MFKRVRDMDVQCSLQVRNFNQPGFAISDCCGYRANSAVLMENGDKMWRCDAHAGMRRIDFGKVLYYVEGYADV